jgi:hypothetical protein
MNPHFALGGYKVNIRKLFRLSAGLVCSAALVLAASNNLQPGKAELKSAGALAFGPNGILFVGDTPGAAIFALDVKDTTPAKSSTMEVTGINDKIAAMLGTTADQILINDTAVNPISKNVYLSVSRGRGPDAVPVILRITAAGKISEVSLADIPHSSVKFADAPAAAANGRQVETITSIAYVDGNVVVAGLSNEEFSSSLRSIPFPFTEAVKGAGIQIYHGSHGRFETAAPVRTFVPFEIGNQKQILAAYTCTPLVKIPVSELKPGAKVQGVTIAELGAQNRPLDMIVYERGGKHFILMANSNRGVMKLSADGLEAYKPITAQTEPAGVPYETIAALQGVQHLNKVDDSTGLILQKSATSLDLRTIALP